MARRTSRRLTTGAPARRVVARLARACQQFRDRIVQELHRDASLLARLPVDGHEVFPVACTVEEMADACAQATLFSLLAASFPAPKPLAPPHRSPSVETGGDWTTRLYRLATQSRTELQTDVFLAEVRDAIATLPEAARTEWLEATRHWYEDFLARYDPQLRRRTGSFYTPVELVRAQVHLVDDLLIHRLARPAGVADRNVVLLDPAAGTGSYLLELIHHGLAGSGAGPAVDSAAQRASNLAANLQAWEVLAGPAAVAELLVQRALARGGCVPDDGGRVRWADVLTAPPANDPASTPEPRSVSSGVPGTIRVCLGNPPYHRHAAATVADRRRAGGWVRWGIPEAGVDAIFQDFLQPALAAGHGRQVKNLYNQYVYFWRWALWWACEQAGPTTPGIVCFVTSASYLEGAAFGGMREYLRRTCDEIWVLDLGGEKRGPRTSDNVFAIRSPVAVMLAARFGCTDPAVPAPVHIARIDGSYDDKLMSLDAVRGFDSLSWADCSAGWQAKFQPTRQAPFFNWPRLRDLFPWQHSGVQLKRTWPIAPDPETLRRRWQALLQAADRRTAFRPSGDRDIDHATTLPLLPDADLTPIGELPDNSPPPPIVEYGYRSFDRQFLLADMRLISRPRPVLWRAHGPRQIYLTSLFSQPLGVGPAVTVTACVPDLDHFRGSYGAKAVLPLYGDVDGRQPNLQPGWLDLLAATYSRPQVTAEQWLAYVYGLLACPAYTDQLAEPLLVRELRLPITRSGALFDEVQTVGRHLLWLHTFGHRLVPPGLPLGRIPPGRARCLSPVPPQLPPPRQALSYDRRRETLHIGAGRFEPIAAEVFELQVSGLRVVPAWLKHRLPGGRRRRASPLDEIGPAPWSAATSQQLLELLWVLEATVEAYPRQAELLSAVIHGPCLTADARGTSS